MKTVSDIRKEFLDYFAGKGHKVVASSPLVPQNDPTLMFVNAGMVQFKDVFTGKEKRDYSRATSSQKCVRAGGKHNDLDNVGYTARHHTFFEMLGNFSFGDYFKDDAIAMAWELVTKNFGLPADKLLVTVHSTDEEAAEIWKKVTGFSDDKVIRIPTSDNFWAMGDTGPCGPCTEIFYDHGEHIPGGPPGSENEDGDRFIEIWNNVFMQFEQIDADTRIDLPKPSVDTGMGLERIAAIMQGKHDNYDIDLLRGIIEHSADLTGVSPDGDQAPSHRVIADHLRCSAFLLADGVMPSNEGRGYVLRRIMRRGMRHAHLLGAEEPLMHKLFPTLNSLMGDAYPELRRAEALITETLKMEETRFKKTLAHGLKLLDEETANLSSGQKFSGDTAFKLYDTYGFPIDLTQDALRAKGIAVDMDGFNAAMDKQKATARANWSGSGDTATEKLWYDLLEAHGATDFLGYKTESGEGQILAIVKDGALVDELKEGEEGQIVTNQTPFYGESGGQVGDHGAIKKDDAVFDVTDTQKKVGKLFVHNGTVSKGTLKKGDAVQMQIDTKRRSAIRANHSATHLLHAALREKLGEHVTQKGSVVDDKRLRFDISHPKAMSAEEIAAVEQRVLEEIKADTEVVTRLMPQEDAIAAGAMALFGEKYDDEVRVLTMGTEKDGKHFSVELCGGTHASRTSDIADFKITSESAVSSGVRRLEAVTGEGVALYAQQKQAALQETLDRLTGENTKLREALCALGGSIDTAAPQDEQELIKENKKLQKEISDQRRKQVADGAESSDDDVKDVGGFKFSAKVLDGFPPKDLKPMVDELKGRIGSGVVTLIAVNDGKASIVVGVTEDLTGRISAVDLVKIGAEKLGGKGGGGRPDMAQAGGPDADAANDAVSAIEQALDA
ncbi:MAG: alanine--tRNA ligase [Rhodospirillales bacterium]|nr:alanine--tRNA ligase [Rhodospirillales bacterium]MCB9996950.1 alanine--tRNA ligase [Rhodospirillales bacterium]